MLARMKVRAKRTPKKKEPKRDALLSQTPWKEIIECCEQYRLQRSKEQVIQVTSAFIRGFVGGYPVKPKPPKEAYHQASKCAKEIVKLAQKLSKGIHECREEAAHVVLGRDEGDFREEVYRFRLNDPAPILLWWKYYNAFEMAESAKMTLLEVKRAFREIDHQELRGRPAHVVFDTWADGMYGIWKQHHPERYSYNKKHYWGESLEFLAKVLNLVKPLLAPSVRQTLPANISEEATAEKDQHEIDAIGSVIHKLACNQTRRKRAKAHRVHGK